MFNPKAPHITDLTNPYRVVKKCIHRLDPLCKCRLCHRLDQHILEFATLAIKLCAISGYEGIPPVEHSVWELHARTIHSISLCSGYEILKFYITLEQLPKFLFRVFAVYA